MTLLARAVSGLRTRGFQATSRRLGGGGHGDHHVQGPGESLPCPNVGKGSSRAATRAFCIGYMSIPLGTSAFLYWYSMTHRN